ncbi:MAG: hypothetical protein JXB32_15060 [Deltaproteobacteria bacterium]|nr:hypothetical protein [Deltaproteobacteria bacterium]
MPARPAGNNPDPAALAALQAETERALRERLEQLRGQAAALTLETSAESFAAVLDGVGGLRERFQHDQRMGRLARGAGRTLQREIDELGRTVQERRRERGRQRAEQREVGAAHAMALPGAVQEFVAAVEAYDPLARGRAKADAVGEARRRVQELLEAGADRGKAREALARFDEARQALTAKYRQRDAEALDAEAQVEGLLLGLRAALAEVDADAPKERLTVASNARRKVVDAFRGLLLPRDVRARLQAAFEPLDRRHAEILRLRHEAYLERKARREERDREARERRVERDRELVRFEAKLLHYAAAYCSRVYAFDPAEAPRGEAAKVRQSRRPFDLLLRERGGRISRVNRIVAAVRTAALDLEALLEDRRRIFVRDGHPAEDTGTPEAPPVEVPEASAEPTVDHPNPQTPRP